MKRFFMLFLAVLVCVSLCVNMAFASDVVTAPVDQNILVYFPWFGGVSGGSANRVTNYATVTSSDVSTTSDVYINQLAGMARDVNSPNNGVVITGYDGGFTIDSFTWSRNTGIWTWNNVFTGSGHKLLIMVSNPSDYYYSFGSGDVIFRNNIVVEDSASGYLGIRLTPNTQVGNYPVSVIDITSLGLEGTAEELTNIILGTGFTVGSPAGQYPFAPVSSFSLVPAPAANGGSSSHQINDYTWYQYEADVSLSGEDVLNQNVTDWLASDVNYSYWYSYIENSGTKYQYVWTYGSRDFAESIYPNGVTVSYIPGDELTNMSISQTSNYRLLNVQVDPDKVPLILSNNGTAYGVYSSIRLNVNNLIDTTLNNTNEISTITLNDPTDFLSSDRVFGDGQSNYEGSFTIDRIFRTIDSSYFLFNNQVNLGTYDFNVNVKFPSLAKFNSFSGYWSASFNTSWGEIPVRTQIQEVSSNSDTLIKIYKLTFDVPFTGQYTTFNIKYVGDRSAFTTIRVDASVIDPNGYVNGAGPTTINGLSFYLTSMFDKFWGKIRSLFFDQDQTLADSVPVESSALNEEVSSGSETIHEFETNNFDSIETQQENIDWDIPTDFGDISDNSSAIGFVSMLFMGIYQALGVKVQYVIVVPLILGLVLLVLGRGSMALGKLVDSLKR